MNNLDSIYHYMVMAHLDHKLKLTDTMLAEIALYFETRQTKLNDRYQKLQREVNHVNNVLRLIETIR